MSNMIRLSVPTTGAAMLAAPRHVWLATLGAAAVTREWAEKEAAPIFRTLVKEGSVVESRALRVVGNRVETSMTHANALVRDARSSVRATVESLASIASSFVRSKAPALRARVAVEATGAQRKRAVKPVKGVKAATKKRAMSTRRAAKPRTQK